MTPDAALLQAILTDPSDDLPRLAYADWCEEHGHTDRANFIRAQLALFHGPRGYKTEQECPRSLRHHWREDRDLYRRVEEQCKPGPDQIAQDLFGKPSAEVEFEFTVDFERGFLFRIETTQAAFLEHAERIFRRCPVEWAVLTDREPDESSIAEESRYIWICSPADAGHFWFSDRYDTIRPELWDCFEGRSGAPQGSGGFEFWREYPSPASAHADLSRACVRHGRRLAGLPDLWQPPRPTA